MDRPMGINNLLTHKVIIAEVSGAFCAPPGQSECVPRLVSFRSTAFAAAVTLSSRAHLG